MVGSIGATLGINHAAEVDGGTSVDTGDVGYIEFSGDVAFPVGQNFLIGIDGNYRFDNFKSVNDFDSSEDPESQHTLTLHGLYKFSDTTRAGVFLSYGSQLPQDHDSDDSYDYYLIGVEGQTMISGDILAYGQFGIGSKASDGPDDDQGFFKGVAVRGGLTYFLNDQTALNLDIEYAGSENYVDSSDPGRHFGISVGGETRLNTSAPLFVNYSVSYAHFNSTDEGDAVEEISVGLGLKYVFGANTPRERWTNGIAYGSPRLPVRASAWTEYLE